MNEPARETLPGVGAAGFVPRQITGPVLAGTEPGQPPAVLHRAAELAYSLNVKLICAYMDITSSLTNEPNDGPADDAEATSAGILPDALRRPGPGTGPVCRIRQRIRHRRRYP